MSKAKSTRTLRADGLDEDATRDRDVEFARTMPDAHAQFLVSLALGRAEVGRIRTCALRAGAGTQRQARDTPSRVRR